MIIVKYTKRDNAIFIPHLDLLRCFNRTIRRANIDVEFSQGFNPHMQIFFAPPLPIGLSSVCEYCCIDTQVDALTFGQKFNINAPQGLRIIGGKTVDKNPNIAGISKWAKYRIDCQGIAQYKSKILQTLSLPSYIYTYQRQTKTVEVDIIPKIKSLDVQDNYIECILGCNTNTLRADKLMEALEQILGIELDYEAERTDLYVEDKQGNIISVDKYLELNLF